MRSLFRWRWQVVSTLETLLLGLFFVQSIRFLIGAVYSRLGAVSVIIGLDPASLPAELPGIVAPDTVTGELALTALMLLLPLLALLLGRFRVLLAAAAALTALGRVVLLAGAPFTPIIGAALAVGGGLLYTALLIRFRPAALPTFFLLGLGVDQALRAAGNTLDPSASPEYLNVQLILSAAAILAAVVSPLRRPDGAAPTERGLLPFWGGIGLGGLLFLQIALLALPNAIAGRAGVDYTLFAPFVALATLLPLTPWIRQQARAFLSIFDAGLRGWVWMLLLALLLLVGTRFRGIFAGAALVFAQFAASLTWWWIIRPQAERERSFSGLWLTLGMALFFLLVAADNFTYEYAYVRPLAGELAFLNDVIPPFLRGFRGMGLGLLLLAAFLASLPIIQTRRRIPWPGGSASLSLLGLAAAAAVSIGVAAAVQPPVISGVRGVDRIRVGTYNIHGGFNEFYHYDLEAIARTIQQSGANAVLLQQTEAGRLTSFGVDQPLWLARRLGMDRRFFPTNEGLQGLAILSNIEIVYSDQSLLTSLGQQTGLQRVQLRPDTGIVTLYNLWLNYLLDIGDGRSIEQQEQEQERQLRQALAIINAQHPNGNLGRMVIGGTFNNIPDSPLGDLMRAAGFSDPFAGLPAELTATLWRTGLPRVRLDYIWVRSMLALGAVVMDSSASDHRMAVVEMLITRQGQ